MSLTIPEAFARGIRGESGAKGDEWLQRLPRLVDETLIGWGLTRSGPVLHGYLAIVVKARDTGSVYAVKFMQPGPGAEQEAAALSAWQGNGAVELLRTRLEIGALLLELLDSGRSLSALPIDEAVGVAGSLLRRLAISPPPGIESLGDRAGPWIESWRKQFEVHGHPFPKTWLDAAIDVCLQLAPSADCLLVNEDLHFDNVLAGAREPWSVIDPKVVVGDLEYGVAPMLWNRFEDNRFDRRLASIVEAADLDTDKTRAWLLVRMIDLWLWTIPLGFTDYAAVCAAVTEWLIGLD
jgi:streptomycin 6-kinase